MSGFDHPRSNANSHTFVGAHILSGCVLEPRALYELLGPPEEYASTYGSEAPIQQKATRDRMLYLTQNRAIPMPHPPQMSNKGASSSSHFYDSLLTSRSDR